VYTFKRFNISKRFLHRTIQRCLMRTLSAVAELLVLFGALYDLPSNLPT